MLTTEICRLFGITHPVVSGGMGQVTNPELVAAVSNAGALGVHGCAGRAPEEISRIAGAIREQTGGAFGLNLLLFLAGEPELSAVLGARPPVFSTAWPAAGADLAGLFARAHDVGATVMHMVSTVAEAQRAVDAGADVIVAQGTEGGGHVGLIGTMVLVPMVVRAVAPVPVVAAGGLADGAGLAAALVLGAEGALFGTRFLATDEAPVPPAYKQVLVDSDGHNTIVTEIPDVASGIVWPGAYARTERNRFVEAWLGREGELRYRQPHAGAVARQAMAAGDVDNAIVYTGQSAGLIDAVQPAAAVVERLVADAADVLRRRADVVSR